MGIINNFKPDIRDIVGFLCLFGSLLLFIPIVKAKYRLTFSVIAFVFALLASLLFYIRALLAFHISAFTDKWVPILDSITRFLPIIFLLLVLLSLAENRKQAIWITSGYILIIIILSSCLYGIFPGFTGFIPLILVLTLFTILTRKIKKPVLGLAILSVAFGYFGVFCLISPEGLAFHRSRAVREGYVDVRLYLRDFNRSHSQPENDLRYFLRKMREVIDRYHQENGVYPSALDGQIYAEYSYWFIWDEIPGKGEKLLIDFIGSEFKRRWAKDANIKKSVDNKRIMVRKEGDLITLELKEDRINVKVGDEYPWGYPIKKRDGKVYVYTNYTDELPGILSLRDTCHHFSNKLLLVPTTPNQPIQPSQITDEGGWIYSPDSGDIRINCSHKDSKGVPYYEW